MRIRSAIISAVLAVCSATVVQALDRDARVIGQAGVDYISYRDMDVARVTVWDETALSFEREWAVVAGLGVGHLSGSGIDGSPTALFAALGTKWYPGRNTSVLLMGTGEWVTSGEDFSVIGGTIAVEQRFTTQQAALSPFVTLSASILRSRVDLLVADEGSFSCLLLNAGAGCDLILTEDATLVFNVTFAESQGWSTQNKNKNFADGWGGSVALKYHWF